MLLFKNFPSYDGIKDGHQNSKNMDVCALYSFDHEQQTNNTLLTPIIVGVNVSSCSYLFLDSCINNGVQDGYQNKDMSFKMASHMST